MNRWCGQTAFITGASSGIGRAISEKLVAHGIKVVGFARRKALLEDIEKKLLSQKGKFYPYAGDVTKEADIIKALEWTKEKVGPVSILINNAGVLRLARLSEIATSDLRNILDVNVLAVAITSREAIKQMKEKNIAGHIININSIAGHRTNVTPCLNLYQASKHALTSLTENLRIELGSMGYKIKVTSVSPGTVDTDILAPFKINTKEEPEQSDDKKPLQMLQSSDVADAVVYVLSTPISVNISELTVQVVGEQY